jgi:hypothetical protein
MLLGSLIALLIAFIGAAWMWLSLESHSPLALVLGAAALVLVASALAARCLGHLFDSFGLGVQHAARPERRECPSCSSPVRPGALRCSSCMELL